MVNADAPYWLVGMTEMTRTFGLELLESVLNDFPQVFLQVSQSMLVCHKVVLPDICQETNIYSSILEDVGVPQASDQSCFV